MVEGKIRRKEIIRLLTESKTAIKGSEFATRFGVSRQVIVQDMAILRAKGIELIASPKGYMLKKDNNKLIKKLITKHITIEEMKKELEIILKYNAIIIDVIVEHEIYGEITGNLHISNNEELNNFIKKISNKNVEPLSKLTNGIHLHTIEIDSIENFNKILDELRENNLLYTY
ncbi:hypothetical protein EV215_0766 [Hypnocyclicus thermotrophus]|uniref:Transcriptional regulator n=1 Tax=Hypnocyclicus thermotrophus TaxID=1627895 RepID=A0AA46DYX9_9FUSO|nr:transcription repressor NadR [Hypnocyclicus thermotrophus]TDT71393.1 hypothetical protein EV215_0766 [Hypnocyclicus thermotrophus]